MHQGVLTLHIKHMATSTDVATAQDVNVSIVLATLVQACYDSDAVRSSQTRLRGADL